MTRVADLSAARRRAWVTRRTKYGAAGHSADAYRDAAPVPQEIDREAESWPYEFLQREDCDGK